MALRNENTDLQDNNALRSDPSGPHPQFMARSAVNEPNDSLGAAYSYDGAWGLTALDRNIAFALPLYSNPQTQSSEFGIESTSAPCYSPPFDANYNVHGHSSMAFDESSADATRLINDRSFTVSDSRYHPAPSFGSNLNPNYDHKVFEDATSRDQFTYPQLGKRKRPSSNTQRPQDFNVVDHTERGRYPQTDIYGSSKTREKPTRARRGGTYSSATPPLDPLASGNVLVADVHAITSLFYSRFQALMVKTCKPIGSSIIEAICPSKASDFPYHNPKKPECHQRKPAWWPADVAYVSPHRMQKPALFKFLSYIVPLPLTNPQEYHGLCEKNPYAYDWGAMLDKIHQKLQTDWRDRDYRDPETGEEVEAETERNEARLEVLGEINTIAGWTARYSRNECDHKVDLHYGPVPDACFHKAAKGRILSYASNKGRKRQRTGELSYISIGTDVSSKERDSDEGPDEGDENESVPAEATTEYPGSVPEIIYHSERGITPMSQAYLGSTRTSFSTLGSNDRFLCYTDPSVSPLHPSEFGASQPISNFGMGAGLQPKTHREIGVKDFQNQNEPAEGFPNQHLIANSMNWNHNQEQQAQIYPGQLHHGLSQYAPNAFDNDHYFDNSLEPLLDGSEILGLIPQGPASWSQYMPYNQMTTTASTQPTYTLASETPPWQVQTHPGSKFRFA